MIAGTQCCNLQGTNIHTCMGLESIKNKHSTRDRQVANCTRDLQVARMKNFSIGYLVFCSPREFSYVPSFPFREYIVLINLFLRTLCVSIIYGSIYFVMGLGFMFFMHNSIVYPLLVISIIKKLGFQIMMVMKPISKLKIQMKFKMKIMVLCPRSFAGLKFEAPAFKFDSQAVMDPKKMIVTDRILEIL